MRAYFELNGYFVRTNVPYRPGTRDDASAIDIVAVHPGEGRLRGLRGQGLANAHRLADDGLLEGVEALNFTTEPATAAAHQLIGERPFRHVLVVPPVGAARTDKVRAYASDHGVELWEWPQLLKEMTRLVSLRKNARNPTDHLLRVLRL